jgi:hypothetical protein
MTFGECAAPAPDRCAGGSCTTLGAGPTLMPPASGSSTCGCATGWPTPVSPMNVTMAASGPPSERAACAPWGWAISRTSPRR